MSSGGKLALELTAAAVGVVAVGLLASASARSYVESIYAKIFPSSSTTTTQGVMSNIRVRS